MSIKVIKENQIISEILKDEKEKSIVVFRFMLYTSKKTKIQTPYQKFIDSLKIFQEFYSVDFDGNYFQRNNNKKRN